MASGFTLAIPYDQLLLLVMALFMFVGATRGWYREFISTAVLISLTVFLLKPELAAPVVRYTAGFSRIVVAFLRSGFSLDLGRLADSVDQVTLPFDASNPYMLFVVSLVLFVLLSYTTGGARSVSALSRLLGGLLGLFNGFLVVSLFKEYVVKYFQKSLPEIAAASVSPDVAVSVSGLPTGSLLTGGGSTLVVVLLALIAGVLLTSTVTGRPIGKR
jgi:hypothetical protein